MEQISIATLQLDLIKRESKDIGVELVHKSQNKKINTLVTHICHPDLQQRHANPNQACTEPGQIYTETVNTDRDSTRKRHPNEGEVQTLNKKRRVLHRKGGDLYRKGEACALEQSPHEDSAKIADVTCREKRKNPNRTCAREPVRERHRYHETFNGGGNQASRRRKSCIPEGPGIYYNNRDCNERRNLHQQHRPTLQLRRRPTQHLLRHHKISNVRVESEQSAKTTRTHIIRPHRICGGGPHEAAPDRRRKLRDEIRSVSTENRESTDRGDLRVARANGRKDPRCRRVSLYKTTEAAISENCEGISVQIRARTEKRSSCSEQDGTRTKPHRESKPAAGVGVEYEDPAAEAERRVG